LTRRQDLHAAPDQGGESTHAKLAASSVLPRPDHLATFG
jgi:hypothetical protein